MKVSEVIDRIKRIEIITDKIEDKQQIGPGPTIDDIIDLLDEYKDELLNKVVK
jgi:hypothetical protein